MPRTAAINIGGEDFAHAALEREAPIGGARIGRLAGALGAEVHEAIPVVAHLGEQETAPVAQIGIIGAELMPMVS